MIENWIDTLCAVWEISDQRFGTVKSFKLVGATDFPDSIDPSELDVHPIALTIPAGLDPFYSAGGPKEAFYSGVTEFHLTSDLSRARVPALLPFYGAILRAAAGNLLLSGLVENFTINGERGIEGPVALQYGNEALHWGFVVNWTVKEKVNLTVGDPSVT